MRRVASFVQAVVILGLVFFLSARFRVGGWLLVVALVGAVAWSSRREAAATVEIVGDTIVIRMIGLDRVWALRSRLSVPLVEVESVEVVEDRRDLPRPRWRTGGTSVPGLKAGWFRGNGLSYFYAVHRGRRVLVLGLRGSHPDLVVISVARPDAVATQIRNARQRT